MTNESILFKQSDNNLLIVKELYEDFTVQRERLWSELDSEWDKLIQISGSKIQLGLEVTQSRLDRLTIFSHLRPSVNFVFASKMKQFSTQFVNMCDETLIQNLSQVSLRQEDENQQCMIFEPVEVDSPSPLEVLELKLNAIEQMLNILNENLFKYETFCKSSDKKIKLVHLFAKMCAEEFLRLIYEQLVINVIPVRNLDYDLETRIDERIKQFEARIHSIGFHTDKKTQFENNLEELFIRKKCKHVIESARELMKQNELVFELVQVNTGDQLVDVAVSLSTKLQKDLYELYRHRSSQSIFTDLQVFGSRKYKISQLAQRVSDLVYQTLNDAYQILTESKQNVKNVFLLCLIARNLFDLFASIVPVYHENNLKSLPILPVIMFNDFSFLAVNCLTLSHQYKSLLESFSKLKPENASIAYDIDEIVANFSFLDLVVKLTSTGQAILFKEIEKQEQNLLELLNENSSGLNSLAEANNLDLYKQSMRKCVHQLKSLSSLWKSVLSEDSFNKIFGRLLDLVLGDLIKSCLRLEDISSDDASYMHEAFLIPKQFIHELYADEHDNNSSLSDLKAEKCIPSWPKYKYLLVLLKANLQEIVDLWSEGHGPLPLCFDSEEVRHLIRALFMNTDRRAAALAKIK